MAVIVRPTWTRVHMRPRVQISPLLSESHQSATGLTRGIARWGRWSAEVRARDVGGVRQAGGDQPGGGATDGALGFDVVGFKQKVRHRAFLLQRAMGFTNLHL